MQRAREKCAKHQAFSQTLPYFQLFLIFSIFDKLTFGQFGDNITKEGLKLALRYVKLPKRKIHKQTTFSTSMSTFQTMVFGVPGQC